MRRSLVTILLCGASFLSAAEFQSYQAATAVLGQSNFSSTNGTLAPLALSLNANNLFVADAAGRLLTFDLSQIGNSKTPGCPVCVPAPASSLSQIVFNGIARVAVHKGNIVVADPDHHRVLLWKNKPPLNSPDLILTGLKNPTSVALDDRHLFIGDSASHHVYIWNALPSSASLTPDETLGAFESSDSAGADTIQSPTALASDGTNLYVADSGSHRVLLFAPSDSPAPEVLNAATLESRPVAPGTLMLITNTTTPATVLLNGYALPIMDSDGDQIQVQIPFELNNAAAASLWIKTEMETAAVALRFTTTSPGIFGFGSVEPRTGLLLHSAGNAPLSPEDPAKPSETLTVWVTGLGAVSSQANPDGGSDVINPVRALVNGSPVEVLSAALPAEAAGVYEIRLRLPSQLPANATLVLLQNEVKSNTVVFPVVQNPE